MNILVIAPHPDDEVIGVGGTIAKRVAEGHSVYVCIVTKASEPLFTQELIEQGRCECKKADGLLGVTEIIFLDFPAVMLETVPRYKLNEKFLQVIKRIRPEEVYIPHRGDMQLDHKMTVDAAMVALRPKYAFRPKRIYAYETLSETGWDVPNVVNEFIPTVYEDITGYVNAKIDSLKEYKSQIAHFPNARSLEAVEALATFRGSTVGVSAAEAFYLVREIK